MVKRAAMILGYVEDKTVGENLGQVPAGSRSTRSTMWRWLPIALLSRSSKCRGSMRFTGRRLGS